MKFKHNNSVCADTQVTEEYMPETVTNDGGEEFGSITVILDKALSVANRVKRNSGKSYGSKLRLMNPCFIGGAGAGKTQIINQWAQANGLNLFTYKCDSDESKLAGMAMPNGQEEINGKLRPTAETTRVHTLDQLDQPNSVLFLDEVNRCPNKNVVNILLGLVDEHVLPDSFENGGKRYFPNLLFTIAAINPSSDEDDTYVGTSKLDAALVNRFSHYYVIPKISEWAPDYFIPYAKEALADARAEGDLEDATHWNGAIEIAKALATDGRLEFNGPDIPEADAASSKIIDMMGHRTMTSPRSLDALLNSFDGTKDDFIREWNSFCDPAQKQIVREILSGYVDVDDEVAKSLSGGTDSKYFNDRGIKDMSNLGNYRSAQTNAFLKKLQGKTPNRDEEL